MNRILLVEDENGAVEVFKNLLSFHSNDFVLEAVAGSVKEGVEMINSFKPDILVLDISLPDGTGFDILEIVEVINFEVVFITAYEQFALQAIKKNAFDYLLKPIHSKELHNCLLRLKEKISEKKERNSYKKLAIHTLDGIEFIDFNEILFLKSESNYTEINLINGKKHLASKTLKVFEDLLDNNFIRVHQSYIISLAHIKLYSKSDSTITLIGNVEVPVSKSRRESLLKTIL
ncbi:MAG: LytTR family DNA-binding domain-containing protein [Chitinophagales bacterium]